jgi:hypothetical protein
VLRFRFRFRFTYGIRVLGVSLNTVLAGKRARHHQKSVLHNKKNKK